MVFVFINYQQNQNSLPHSLHPNVSTAASPSRDWVPPLQSQSNWLSPWKVAMKGLNPISEARDAFSKCEGFLQSRGALAYMAPRDYHPFQPQGWALRFSCTGKRLKVSEKPCFSTTSKNQSHGHKTSPGLSAVLDPRYHSENENKTKKPSSSLISRYCNVHLFPHHLEFQEQNSGNELELLGFSVEKHSVLFSSGLQPTQPHPMPPGYHSQVTCTLVSKKFYR